MTGTTTQWDSPWLRSQVQHRIDDFLKEQSSTLRNIAVEADAVSDAITEFLAGGKRIRGVLAYWGWRAAGHDHGPEIVDVAAAMEFLQACALIHDDVMDASETRRGKPTVHRVFRGHHETGGWSGPADTFGEATAILLGDLCLTWSDELLLAPDWNVAAYRRGKTIFDLMRTELMIGQYLDILEQARGTGGLTAALRVADYKSGKYSVQRPLQLGASFAEGPEALIEGLGHYGSPLGQAFQLRDDLLGVFGTPDATGKPAGDDLREGKRTALIALTESAITGTDAAFLSSHLGNPDLDAQGVAELRSLITDSGATLRVEQLIAALLDTSLTALNAIDMPADVKAVLGTLANSIAYREA
ncbi:MAG: polyprenyl synthetase family protein [Actinomycetia bacterium]|nr:polyprenyl synthetase family protein [Actinomycetes bacterium]